MIRLIYNIMAGIYWNKVQRSPDVPGPYTSAVLAVQAPLMFLTIALLEAMGYGLKNVSTRGVWGFILFHVFLHSILRRCFPQKHVRARFLFISKKERVVSSIVFWMCYLSTCLLWLYAAIVS